MLTKHEHYYDSGMDALVIVCSWNTNGIMIWANVMRGIRSISGPPNRKTRCVVYAVFRALETLPTCGSCHAGHIRRGRPSMHFLRVYVPAEPITITITIAITIIIGFKAKENYNINGSWALKTLLFGSLDPQSRIPTPRSSFRRRQRRLLSSVRGVLTRRRGVCFLRAEAVWPVIYSAANAWPWPQIWDVRNT